MLTLVLSSNISDYLLDKKKYDTKRLMTPVNMNISDAFIQMHRDVST